MIFTGIFALGAFQIYRQLKEYEEGDSAYTDVEQYVTVGEDGQKDENPSDENTNINWPAVDFAALKEIIQTLLSLSDITRKRSCDYNKKW